MGGLFAKPKTPKAAPPTRLTPPEERKAVIQRSMASRNDEREGASDTNLTNLGGGMEKTMTGGGSALGG
jgi:hypothetical protein